MLLQRRTRIEEDHALRGEFFLDLVIHGLRVVLGADAGEELLLRLRDAEPVERLLDIGRDVVPGLSLFFGRLEVIVDVLEVDLLDRAAPSRQRLALEVLQRFQAKVAHPGGLAFDLRDLRHHVAVQSSPCAEDRALLIVEAVLLPVSVANVENGLAHGFPSARPQAAWISRIQSYPCASSSCASSGPPDLTILPSTRTCTKCGLM